MRAILFESWVVPRPHGFPRPPFANNNRGSHNKTEKQHDHAIYKRKTKRPRNLGRAEKKETASDLATRFSEPGRQGGAAEHSPLYEPRHLRVTFQ